MPPELRDARVVDEHARWPEAFAGDTDRIGGEGVVAYVADHGLARHVVSPDQLGGLIEVVRGARHHGERRAALGEVNGERPAKTAAGTGHDRHRARQWTFHPAPPVEARPRPLT